MISKMSFKFITTILLFINFDRTQQIDGTRLPLEIFDSSKTHQPPVHSSSSSTTTTQTAIYHNSQQHSYQNVRSVGEHRKGRTLIGGNSGSTTPIHTPPRILYQVGNSEDDLPICAPNAVCSKVDLYETPWIERQCRCPAPSSTSPVHRHIIYHHKPINTNNNQNLLPSSSSTSSSSTNTKYQQYYDDEIRLQQKRMLDLNEKSGDDDDVDTNVMNEHKHIRDILKKLGTIYDADDILQDHSTTNNREEIGDHYLRQKSAGAPKNTRFRHGGLAHRNDFTKTGGCSSYIGMEDGHTIADKTRQYKLCDPVHKLPVCRYFRDYTWTLISSPDANTTEQIVHCRCPKNSITYLIKREPLKTVKLGYTYMFACSPQSRLRCLRKEPCKLFTVRKRQEFLDEVNTNPLCQCPRNHSCPKHHTDSGVIAGKSYIEDNIRTYSGYCIANQ